MQRAPTHPVGMPLPSPQRKRVLVLNTGGRVGMKTFPNGKMTAKSGYLAAQLNSISDFQQSALPHFEVVEMEHVEHSVEWRAKDWIRLGEEIYRNYFDFDGFVVIHGTDTMHYTASALSFMFHNLSKAVVFTGAMVPLEESFNDARRNLTNAMMFAAHNDICEVCIYFNNALMRATRTVLCRRTLNAFDSPNFPTLADFGYEGFTLKSALFLRQPKGPFFLSTSLSEKVVSAALTPGSDIACLTMLFPPEGERICDALVLEIYGFGDNASSLAKALKKLSFAAKRVGALLVVVCPWLIHGTPSWFHRLLQFDEDLVQVGDMTSECAVVKAMYLCGQRCPLDEARRLMRSNLRGEMAALPTLLNKKAPPEEATENQASRGLISHL